MLPRELRTRIIKRMTSQKVEYVQDWTRVQYGLCLYLFVVAWRDSPIPEHLNTPLEARHSQRKEQKNKRKDKRKRNNDHPLELNIPKCDQPKHPKIPKETSLKANQDLRMQTAGLTETHGPGWRSVVLAHNSQGTPPKS